MKTEEKHKAIKLREEQGLSYGEIAKTLNVAKSSVSEWCRHIELNERQLKVLEQHCKVNSIIFGRRTKEKWDARKKDMRDVYDPPLHDPEFMLGLGVYWGEGSKYSESLTELSNCDYKLLLCYINWLKKYFNDDCKHLSIRIHHYCPEKDEDIKQYWSEKLSMPLNCFRKSVFVISKSSKNKKGNVQPYGTAHVVCCGDGNWKVRQKISKALSLVAPFV